MNVSYHVPMDYMVWLVGKYAAVELTRYVMHKRDVYTTKPRVSGFIVHCMEIFKNNS